MLVRVTVAGKRRVNDCWVLFHASYDLEVQRSRRTQTKLISTSPYQWIALLKHSADAGAGRDAAGSYEKLARSRSERAFAFSPFFVPMLLLAQRLQREQAVEAAAAKAREAAVEQSRVLVAKAEADVLRAVSASSAASALVPDSVLDGGNSANRAHLDRLAEAVAAGPTASTLVAAGVLAQLQPLSTADRLRLRLQRSSGTVAAAGHRSGRYARACETLLSLASRTPPPPALPELLTALSALLSADEPSALKCVESNALNSLAPLMVSRESDVAAAALGTLTTLCACCGADPVAAAIKRRGPSPQELMRALVAHLGRGSRHLKPAEAAAAMAALVECMPSAAKIAVTSGALEVLLVRLGMQRHGRPSCCGHESAFACDATTFY
eukprot:1874359-Pleurochrysis_carterae.AAC.10